MGLGTTYDQGQTPLSEEEKEGLLIHSITTQGELNEAEQLNIEEAVEWSLRRQYSIQSILSEKFVCNLHKRMYKDVWRWAGKFRKSNKNLGVDKYQISIELLKLLEDCLYWIEHKTYPEDEIAIRFKHRIVSIHCFANGNGRHSRLMADIIVSHLFGKAVFSWNGGELRGKNDARKEYLVALKEADKGKINRLLQFARS